MPIGVLFVWFIIATPVTEPGEREIIDVTRSENGEINVSRDIYNSCNSFLLFFSLSPYLGMIFAKIVLPRIDTDRYLTFIIGRSKRFNSVVNLLNFKLNFIFKKISLIYRLKLYK